MNQNTLLDCPVCGLPAEIVARFTFDGSPRPVEHVRVACLGGHWFTLPVDSLRLETRSGAARSLFARVIEYLRELWREYDYVNRRSLEIRLGVPMR